MSLTLLTQNRLEDTATVVATSVAAASGKPATRLYDRRKSLQYESGSIAQVDITVDLGSALAVTAWANLNHTITGVTTTLFGEAVSPPTVTIDSVAVPASTDFLRTFGSQALRYWMQRIPVMAAAPLLGELFLGVHKTLPNPAYGLGELYQGLVERDETRAGFVWKARTGSARTEQALHWNTLSDANWTILKAAFDETNQSAKPFPMLDVDGTLYWVEFKEGSLRRRRVFTDVNEVDVTFLQVLS